MCIGFWMPHLNIQYQNESYSLFGPQFTSLQFLLYASCTQCISIKSIGLTHLFNNQLLNHEQILLQGVSNQRSQDDIFESTENNRNQGHLYI